MKVIDLLNEIAKGEQPSHIRVYNRDWYWNNYDGYVTEGSLSTTPDAQIYLFSQYRLDFVLDKEVEIIEDKEIEKITVEGKEIKTGAMSEWLGFGDLSEKEKKICSGIEVNAMMINKLIEAVNELKKGK